LNVTLAWAAENSIVFERMPTWVLAA